MICHRGCLLLVALCYLVLWPASASAELGAWDTLMEAGLKAFEAGNFEEAEGAFSAAAREAELKGSPLQGISLARLGEVIYRRGRLAEAESTLQKALALQEWAITGPGPEHPALSFHLAHSLTVLADLYMNRGHLDRAEPLYHRALAIREKVLGPDNPEVADRARSLAHLYAWRGQFQKAELLYRRALAVYEKALGGNHLAVALIQDELGGTLLEEGNFSEAGILLHRSLAIRQDTLGPDHIMVAKSLNSLAGLYAVKGEYARARESALRSLAIAEKSLGHEHQEVALILGNVAMRHLEQGDFARGELALRQALAIEEKLLGPDHPRAAVSQARLATLLQVQGRYDQAEALYLRAHQILRNSLGEEHPEAVTILSRLGRLYRAQGNNAKAGIFYLSALGVRTKTLGRDHPLLRGVLEDLADIWMEEGRLAEAENLLIRARAIAETSFGGESTAVASALNGLGRLYFLKGDHRWEEALRRALSITEKAHGPNHFSLVNHLEALAVRLMDRDPQAARPVFERMRGILLATGRRNAELPPESLRSFLQRDFGLYIGLLARIARSSGGSPDASEAWAHAFVVAEHTRSGLAQMALASAGVRSAAADPATASLARLVQELQRRRAPVDSGATAQWSGFGPQGRAVPGLDRPAAIQLESQLAQAFEHLVAALPAYPELAFPEPINLGTVQGLLRPGEALVSYFSLEDRLLLWLVRPDRPPVYRDLPAPRADLAVGVQRIRRSLEKPDRVADVAEAYAAYRVLLGPVAADLVDVTHLIVLPDEVLLPLPFGALVTSDQDAAFRTLARVRVEERTATPEEVAAYPQVAWLAKRYAISVLPAATALKALRRFPRQPSARAEPFIGFGDPALRGTGTERGGAMLSARGPAVALDELRSLNRLPGTRAELLALAKVLGADPQTSLFLGPQATKPVVRQLNGSGRLGRARVLDFATHGLIGGEVRGSKEPALVLTPPASPSEEDDGLLGLEDILGLKLANTDWVILSACNTAAPDGSGEGLSGLVRAFFFAGARTLLVSHWSVEDRATQDLMTEVFRRYAADRALPPADALRQGMLALMQKAQGPTAYFAHPFAWAAFFLVGEGGRETP